MHELDLMLASRCKAQIEALYQLRLDVAGIAATLAQDVNDLANIEDALVCKDVQHNQELVVEIIFSAYSPASCMPRLR